MRRNIGRRCRAPPCLVTSFILAHDVSHRQQVSQCFAHFSKSERVSVQFMSAWTDDSPLLSASDSVLCGLVNDLEGHILRQNSLLHVKQYADLKTTGSPLGPRNRPAPCGPKPARPTAADMEKLLPGGFLLDVCPRDSYANQLTFNATKACTRSHQTFLNTTKRGTGTLAGSNRGMS